MLFIEEKEDQKSNKIFITEYKDLNEFKAKKAS
jgi:hypothetical protein